MRALLDESAVAAFLRITRQQVVKLVRAGHLPAVVLPGDEIRFDPADLADWVETHKRPAPQGADQ